jgi:hypothetical protein
VIRIAFFIVMGFTSALQVSCEREKVTVRVTRPFADSNSGDLEEKEAGKKEGEEKKEESSTPGNLEDDKVMAAWGGASFRGNQQFDVIPKE